MTTRRALVVTLVAAIAVGGVMAGLVATGAFGQGQKSDDSRPPDKQTLEATSASDQATVDAQPRSDSKGPFTPPGYTPSPTPESCPINPANVRTEIDSPPIRQFPLWFELYDVKANRPLKVLSDASGVSSEGAPYRVFSGALPSDPQRGVIVVAIASKDPCAEHRDIYFSRKEYKTPFKGGAVTVTQIDDDTVVYQTTDGKTGGFNFVTGKFE